MAKLQITQTRSANGRLDVQAATLHALGLKKIRDCVVQEDNPAIRGMINRVIHLVDVKEV